MNQFAEVNKMVNGDTMEKREKELSTPFRKSCVPLVFLIGVKIGDLLLKRSKVSWSWVQGLLKRKVRKSKYQIGGRGK